MLKHIKSIPTLPQVTVELIKHTFAEEPDISKVASVIQKDPTLTAKLFKTVNAASFGLRAEIKSIPQAISILGLETLRTTIITIAVGEYFINNSFGNHLNIKNFCIHSLACATIMQELAEITNIPDKDHLYVLGLLHDIGRLALDNVPDTDYSDVSKYIDQGMDTEKAERKVFGVDNRQAWRVIARDWKFPSELTAIFNGSMKGKINQPTRKVLKDASNMADAMGFSLSPNDAAASGLKIDEFTYLEDEDIVRIGHAVQNQVDSLSTVLNLPVPDQTRTFKTLYSTARSLSMANLKHKKTQSELQYRIEMLQELTRIFTGIIKSLHGESLYSSVLESIINGFQVNSAFLLNIKRRQKMEGYTARKSTDENIGYYRIKLNRNETPRCIEHCEDSTLPVRTDRSNDLSELEEYLDSNITSAWLVPIRVRDKCTAILALGMDDESDFKFQNTEFGNILHIVAGEISLSIENIRLYNRVKMEASTDSLTCLSNRRTIMKVLNSEFARFKRNPVSLSVAIFDLDNFKSLNDTLGHIAGDEFLKQTAKIIQDGIRKSDYVGRFGGDEFIGVFPDTKAEQLKMVVDRIRIRLLEFYSSYDAPGLDKKLSISIGVAGANEHMMRSDELILCADNALYEAKEQGRNICVVSNG